MAKVKGRYVAQIEINFTYDETEEGLLPFEKIRENVVDGLTPDLKKLIEDEVIVEENGDTVDVTQTYADVWKVEDGDQECRN